VSIDYDDTTPETETANGHDTAAFSDMTRPLIPHQTTPDTAADTVTADTAPAEPRDAAEVEDPDIDPSAAARQVDPPNLPAPIRGVSARRPVLAEWAKGWDAFTLAARGVAGHYWYLTRFHAVRTPTLYAGRLALRCPRGLARVLRHTWRFAIDHHSHQLVIEAVAANDSDLYLKLDQRRRNRVRARWLLLALAAAGATVAGFMVDAMPWFEADPLALAAVLGLGAIGGHADKPLVSRPVVGVTVEKLTSEIVLRALGAIGIEKLATAVAKGSGISFPTEIARDGAGYRTVVDLPYGVTADDVIERRIKLASGLRRPLGCVWPEPMPEDHEGRLMLWVGDQDTALADKPAWPLLKKGRVDLFAPFPIGTDPRGRWIYITLMFASVVIGSIPRMGKTFFMRLLLLAAALDVTAQLYLFELKGTGDFRPLEPVAHRYASGEEDEEILYGLSAMRELREELRRRGRVMRSLPIDRVPESKVTPELAADTSLGLFPIVVAVDECQKWFEHKEHGAELQEIAEDLVKRGPALGIIAMFGTQRPDAKSLPTGISGNAVLRFCLKVIDYNANDMVLGTGMHKKGIKATMFRRRDRGMGYLVGEGDDPQIVASSFVDAKKAEAVVARARALRETAGTITGYAAGVHVAEAVQDAVTVVDDLRAVFDKVRFVNDKVWGEELLAILAEYRPETYGEWKVETLTAALKPHGVKSVNATRRTGEGVANKKGYDRPALTKAVTDRD
jgi:S-DNA-T family DNA segregation ATPase FtsK/SpoIIIE